MDFVKKLNEALGPGPIAQDDSKETLEWLLHDFLNKISDEAWDNMPESDQNLFKEARQKISLALGETGGPETEEEARGFDESKS
jgi:hypothetical protein